MKGNLEKLQTCVLTLNDGEVVIFSGKAVLFEGDTRTVVKIEFTAPTLLPKYCTWEEMKDIYERNEEFVF